MLQLVASSCRELVDTYLVSDEAKVLVASWGLHLDFGPDIAGGAMFPLLEAMADMENGIAIAEGEPPESSTPCADCLASTAESFV